MAKAFRKRQKWKPFLKLGCLKEGWQGDDEAVQDQPLNWALITSISSFYNGKGIPKKTTVEAFLKQRSANTQDDEIIVIKEEATDLISLPHRINDLAPLWVAEPSVKREVGDSRQKQATFFSQIDIPNDRSIRKSINESIARYQDLDDEQRAVFTRANVRSKTRWIDL
ncbi:hypothetical protein [Endozoicomonas sp. SCSIO W0465]|uniref:hypothetical protein n=1 Tax=Endozoicomonas sp. SCSIO W0465 TaxID=2918516 RepID=UPI00207531FF|nr:hypothetical protein [Endozoicomonas sp. SCSIO W0465]USE34816.1 hypothetical protein MJO57_22195 [Endozoicomonas sp. SCSIO W0465]